MSEVADKIVCNIL